MKIRRRLNEVKKCTDIYGNAEIELTPSEMREIYICMDKYYTRQDIAELLCNMAEDNGFDNILTEEKCMQLADDLVDDIKDDIDNDYHLAEVRANKLFDSTREHVLGRTRVDISKEY